MPFHSSQLFLSNLFTDNLAISADGAFESEGETTDSELTPTLLHEFSNGPPQKGCISRHAAIERLPDDVLMEIFIFDRLASIHLSRGRPWGWHRLVHVCRRWRTIIFDSPRSLDLQLFCTYGTHVKDNLDCWPALPIVVQYGGFSSPSPLPPDYGDTDDIIATPLRPPPWAAGDDDNIIAALQHPSRICSIQLTVTIPLLKRLTTLAQEPFLALEHLDLATQSETGLILPSECFGGPSPRLRVLHVARIAFPALQRLLLSAENLISLQLEDLPNNEYISPEALIICLSVMTRLETLRLHFLPRISRPIPRGNDPTPQQRAVLPTLEDFTFHGNSEYLDRLLSGIDAPFLRDIDITFFHRNTTFNCTQLVEFICRTETHSSHNEAMVYCSRTGLSITLTQQGTPYCMGLQVRCVPLFDQLFYMAHICKNLSRIISDVRDLHFDAPTPLSSGRDERVPITLWSLFYRFRNVERLFLTKNVASFVEHALKDDGLPSRVLLNAKVIRPESDSPCLHPRLVARSLQWDMRCHYSQITPHLSPTVLAEPASHPPLPSMILCIGDLPWRATVRPDPRLSSTNTIVTVEDVLTAIYANLRTPVKPDEYNSRSGYTKAEITEAFRRRVDSDLVQPPEGLLRVDFLCGRCHARGLTPAVEDNVWLVRVH